MKPKRKRPSGDPPGRDPPAPHTAGTSDLILPSGRVDRGAIFRAAQEEALRRHQSLAGDPDLVSSGGAAPEVPAGELPDDSDAGDDPGDDSPGPGPGPGSAALAPQRVVFRLTRDLNKRLDKYLTDRISFMSRAKLQDLIGAGGVLVNSRVAKASTKLRVNDTVEVEIQPPPAEDVPPQDLPLDVLYEDAHLVVINKSPDILVHPARSHLSGTMINALAYHFRHRSATGGALSPVGAQFARPGVVHRLDRQTSGVIVFAKTDQAHWNLAHQFQNRTVDKRYVALVHGAVEPPVDVIDVPLGPHPSRERGLRELQVVRHDHLGKPAVSVYRVLGVYPGGASTRSGGREGWGGAGQGRPARPALSPGWKAAHHARHSTVTPGPSSGGVISLIEVELRTGRTHQIRVHLQHRGYPLLADDLYGGRPVTLASGASVNRVALHAALLTFRHPATGVPMEWRAPFPPDLKTFLTALRAGAGATALEPAHPPGARLSVADLV